MQIGLEIICIPRVMIVLIIPDYEGGFYYGCGCEILSQSEKERDREKELIIGTRTEL